MTRPGYDYDPPKNNAALSAGCEDKDVPQYLLWKDLDKDDFTPPTCEHVVVFVDETHDHAGLRVAVVVEATFGDGDKSVALQPEFLYHERPDATRVMGAPKSGGGGGGGGGDWRPNSFIQCYPLFPLEEPSLLELKAFSIRGDSKKEYQSAPLSLGGGGGGEYDYDDAEDDEFEYGESVSMHGKAVQVDSPIRWLTLG